jgi:hypothetical protein
MRKAKVQQSTDPLHVSGFGLSAVPSPGTLVRPTIDTSNTKSVLRNNSSPAWSHRLRWGSGIMDADRDGAARYIWWAPPLAAIDAAAQTNPHVVSLIED